MANKGVGKGVVEVVLSKTKQDGVTPYWVVVVDSKEYYDSKGVFKDKKGQEIEFEWADSNDGKITFINAPGSGARGGGGGRAKSPEELKQQAKSFALSYSKDQIGTLVAATSHLITELPVTGDSGERLKYLEFLHHLNTQTTELTKATAAVYLKWLSE